MSSIITLANLAGGTSKTTTAHNLSVAFTEYGKKVLLIDLDAKGDLTFILGKESARVTIADLLTDKASIDSGVISTPERFDLIPGSSNINNVSQQETFANLLSKCSPKYDLIVLDTPSTPSTALFMALEVSNSILYPIQLTVSSFRGAHRIRSLIKPGIKHLAFLKTDSSRNENLEREIMHDFELLDCEIPMSKELLDNESSSSSVLSSFKNSAISSSYRELGYSILEKLSLI